MRANLFDAYLTNMVSRADIIGHCWSFRQDGVMTRPRTLNVAEAKARLSELVQRAARGEEIIIARNGEPQARLVGLAPTPVRVPGSGAGKWKIADDFNDSLPPDLLAAFEGRSK